MRLYGVEYEGKKYPYGRKRDDGDTIILYDEHGKFLIMYPFEVDWTKLHTKDARDLVHKAEMALYAYDLNRNPDQAEIVRSSLARLSRVNMTEDEKVYLNEMMTNWVRYSQIMRNFSLEASMFGVTASNVPYETSFELKEILQSRNQDAAYEIEVYETTISRNCDYIYNMVNSMENGTLRKEEAEDYKYAINLIQRMLKFPPNEMPENDYNDLKEEAEMIIKYAESKVNGKRESEETVRFMNEYNRLNQDISAYSQSGRLDTEVQDDLESRLYRLNGMLEAIEHDMTREEIFRINEQLEHMHSYLYRTREALEQISRIAHF